MDVTVWIGYLLKVVVFFIPMVVRQTDCQVYSWIGSSTLTPSILPCSNVSPQLEFAWTYTPETPEPALMVWTVRKSGGGIDNIATFVGGQLKVSSAYASRFTRIGATAEFALKNPTTSDEGFYKVSVLDSVGVSINGMANTTEKYISVSNISAKCSVHGGIFTMTCFGTDEPDVPAKCMKLRKNGVLVPGTVKDGTLSVIQDDIDNENITCHLCGVMPQCLPEPGSFICPDCRPCNKLGIAFLIITLSSIVIGSAIIVVKLLTLYIVVAAWIGFGVIGNITVPDSSSQVQPGDVLTLYIVGAVWIGFGLIGTITVPAICSQAQSGDVFACGSVTIASFIISIITFVIGVVPICLACWINTPQFLHIHKRNHKRTTILATTDVTSSQPVNSSSSQGRPSLGPVQSSRGPKSQAGNASLEDSENVSVQINVHNQATQQGEGNPTEKQTKIKEKKKKPKVLKK